MDQFVSMMAERGHALMIDCSNNSHSSIPFNNPDLAVLVTNSGVKHELVDGEYKNRRDTCKVAAHKLEVDSLRLASLDLLQRSKGLGLVG